MHTSSSTQEPPALRMSVCRLGQEVRVRPSTAPASTNVQGPWQMTATGLPSSKKDLANRTAPGCIRKKSGLATPPGSTRPAYELLSVLSTVTSTGKVSALSRWLKACTLPSLVETKRG